jgi:DNA-binding beta-propeller fold protein YncE
VKSSTVIGSGFSVRFDPSALIIGPTGVALDGNQDLLFVADSLNNRIAGIPNPLTRTTSAGTGVTLSQGGALNDPLAMSRVPSSGNIIVSNGGDGNLVEITDDGQQVAIKLVDKSGSPPGSGALFGVLALSDRVFFADDATNMLNVAH